MTAIGVLKEARRLGLTLRAKPGDKLGYRPVRLCPPEFKEKLQGHKQHLLSLLNLPFVMAYSKAVGETIFFCEDEDTKAALVEAGASEWSIYTKDELQVLIAQHRTKPLITDDLCKLHQLKRTFEGRINNQP